MQTAFHSPAEIAKLLGLSKRTILAAIKSGELPAVKYNSRLIRVSATDAALWYAGKGGRVTPCTTRTTSPMP